MGQFNTLAEFVGMGGYGLFVWPSYALTVLTIGGLLVTSFIRHRSLAAQLESAERRRPRGRKRQ